MPPPGNINNQPGTPIMKTININGEQVEISIETFARIEKIARENGTTIADAVRMCLETVSTPTTK